MLTIILTNMLLMLILSMLLAMNPLLMGIMILLMALNIAIIYSYLISSWYAFLIFLIYVGGMLVMFAYFMALMPNQSLSSNNNIMIMLSTLTLLMIMSKISHILPITNIYYNNQLSDLYSSMNAWILILIGLLLLFTMVLVVKISSVTKGPLRAFMYV